MSNFHWESLSYYVPYFPLAEAQTAPLLLQTSTDLFIHTHVHMHINTPGTPMRVHQECNLKQASENPAAQDEWQLEGFSKWFFSMFRKLFNSKLNNVILVTMLHSGLRVDTHPVANSPCCCHSHIPGLISGCLCVSGSSKAWLQCRVAFDINSVFCPHLKRCLHMSISLRRKCFSKSYNKTHLYIDTWKW